MSQEQAQAQTSQATTAPATNPAPAPAQQPAQRVVETRPVWDTEINRFGDIHFKKAMIASANKFSGFGQGDKLQIEFQEGKAIISKKAQA